jgi:transcriptional regulator with XRE-family HTH domain
MLVAHALTQSEIAARLGVARQQVHAWRHGQKSPSPASRATMEREIGIPAHAWDRAPVDRPGTAPRSAPTHEAPQTTREKAIRQIADLQAELDGDGVMLPDRIKIRGEITRLLSVVAAIDRDEARSEEHAVGKHPQWRRIRAILLDELRGVPDVARRVAERLEEIGA